MFQLCLKISGLSKSRRDEKVTTWFWCKEEEEEDDYYSWEILWEGFGCKDDRKEIRKTENHSHREQIRSGTTKHNWKRKPRKGARERRRDREHESERESTRERKRRASERASERERGGKTRSRCRCPRRCTRAPSWWGGQGTHHGDEWKTVWRENKGRNMKT